LAEDQVGGFWRKLSSGLAIVAFALLTVQFVLSSRLQAITGRVGIDITMHFHQLAAKVITVALVLHPVLYLVPTLYSDPAAGLAQLVAMFSNDVFASGVLAWVMLLALTVSAILRDWLPMPYETWRLSHGLTAAALAIAGLHHAINVGSYSAGLTLAQLWIVLVGLTFIVLGYLYLVKPWQLSQRPYYVSHVHRVGEGLWGITLWPAKLQPVGVLARGMRPKVTTPISFEAGQFAWITIGAAPFVFADHPLSIASAPADRPRFRFIVKEVGDFSKALGRFPVGTRAYIDGPYGCFTLSAAEAALPKGETAAGLAFIAGGVGIAPILSLLRDRLAAGETRPMRLIYGNRAASQIVFRDELAKMETAMDFRVHHVLSEPPYEWSGGTGVLDAAVINAWIDWPDPARWIYFVCGPTAMMDVVERALIARGVPPARIISERFKYD
jgi:predicted ferric reductase